MIIIIQLNSIDMEVKSYIIDYFLLLSARSSEKNNFLAYSVALYNYYHFLKDKYINK